MDTHIVFLAETEEAADLGGTLGPEALGVDDVGEAGHVLVALLDNRQGEDGQVHADDAAAHTLALALTRAAGAVAAVAVREQETHTRGRHDALLHRETLLVVAARDAEDVALPLVAQALGGHLVAHALVHEDAQAALLVDLEDLLRAIRGVGDVQLHLGGGAVTGARWELRVVVVVGG